MKLLEAPLLSSLNKTSLPGQVSASLNCLDKHCIDIAPWPEFTYIPKVEFCIAHNKECIFLKYYIQEAVVKAAYYQPDDPVYKDSCVEFFIAFNREEAYYNLEFNAIGTCKLNFGSNRNNRIVVAENLIRKIKYFSNIQNAANGVQWELSLILPLEVFSQHVIKSLSGQTCLANFYKCGDDTPIPHFLCWNNIDTPKPDYHVPRCFGKVLFL